MPTGIYVRTKENANKGKKFSDATKLKMSLANIGRIVSEATRKKISESQCGEKGNNWRGGRVKDLAGYVLILETKHPFANLKGYVFEHRFVIEQFLGRYLTKTEVVHHINGIKDDNRIENLMLFVNNGEHQSYHKQQRNLKCQTSI